MNKRKRIRFIVNPISGIGRQKVIPKLIDEVLDSNRFEAEIAYTSHPKHAHNLSIEAAAQGFDLVAIVGGDGSVNEAGSGLLYSQTALAIIPTGSGNGLARHLKVPLKLRDAIGMINHHHIQSIDTGRLNGHPFMGVAGVGFDAHIAWEFARFGKRGFFSYFKIVLREYMRFKEETYTIQNNNESQKAKAFLLTAANSSQFGNRATIAPEARLDDGKMKVCLLRKFTLLDAPFVAFRLFNSTIHRSRFMRVLEGTHFEVSKAGCRAHVDGDPVNLPGPLHIDVLPSSLKVVVPK